eukprot:8877067-Lingulodinium_polyedra.AAC.1
MTGPVVQVDYSFTTGNAGEKNTIDVEYQQISNIRISDKGGRFLHYHHEVRRRQFQRLQT